MSPVTLIFVLFLVALGVMSFVWGGAGLFVGLPIALIGILLVVLADVRRRQTQGKSMKGMREQASTEDVEFTERDKETLA
jgi:asparagine N-glycosylation enzyme membrane subunit Stt3